MLISKKTRRDVYKYLFKGKNSITVLMPDSLTFRSHHRCPMNSLPAFSP